MRAIWSKTYFKKITGMIAGLTAFLLTTTQSTAQVLNPFGASFFQNQYLANPAMVGMENGLILNAGYREEWSSIPNAPKNQYLTGSYKFNDKAGFGLKIINDNAGLLRITSAMATYSYQFPIFNSNQKIHLGISAGAVNRGLDQSKNNGEIDDPLILNYGNKTKFEADFGAAYIDNNITVQAAFPNMVSYFGKEESDVVDKSFLVASAAYKFIFNEGEDVINIEPKVVFRGIKGHDHIVDFGSNCSLKNNLFNAFAMYHSTKNVTLGAGLSIKEQFRISINYSTGTSALKGYSNGNFEIGLRVALGK